MAWENEHPWRESSHKGTKSKRPQKAYGITLAGQRLLKSSLLRKGWEFEEVYSRGKRLHGVGFTLICQPNSTGSSRLGISVHRKIRGAVKRNRLKRIIRESFRLWQKHYPAGADIVFAVRPDFSCLHPGDIRAAVMPLAESFACCHGVWNENK